MQRSLYFSRLKYVRFSHVKLLALAPALTVLLFAAPASVSAQNHCTSEVLKIKGTPVTVSYCVVGTLKAEPGHETTISVSETYSSPKGSFHQTSPLAFIPGDEPSRVIEDVSLSEVGLAGNTLHLTLVMRGGSVHIEGAMLTPGAITIK